MHLSTAKTRGKNVCTSDSCSITWLFWRNLLSWQALLWARTTPVDKFEFPQITVLPVPSHFEEMRYFCCGCHHLLFAGMWEFSCFSVCPSPTFPVQLLPSRWWKENCCQEPMREGEGALGWCVTAGGEVISGKRKEKPARPGQTPLSSHPTKGES